MGVETDESKACICPRFGDTGGFRIADLGCPTHGVDGSNPGDGYWPCVACGAEGFRLTHGFCDGCHEARYGVVECDYSGRTGGSDG